MDFHFSQKTKIIMIYFGVTLLMYLLLKYIFPIMAPFVIAFLIALIIDKPVSFLAYRFHIKRIVGVMFLMLIIGGVLAVFLYFVGKGIISQLSELVINYDKYEGECERLLSGCCENVDRYLHFQRGQSFLYVSDQLDKIKHSLADNILPALMNGSAGFVTGISVIFTTATVIILAAIFIGKDMEKIRVVTRESVFRREYDFLGDRLKHIVGTYVRTQLIIMLLTSLVCTVGLYFMHNPYALLLGIVIGLVDALPILGTGTVFIPWGIILLIMGRYGQAAAIFILYLICYYGREFIEPKLMGRSLNISPVVMLMSLYIGLVLFGISGVITGPICAIMIREISKELIKNL